ncbi:MAG TPA: SRPBCC family protein [Gammaproteobacteria bacterium]
MVKLMMGTIAVLIAALLIFAAVQPGNFRIQRSLEIKAPPERIFARLNDFHQWAAWSPWEKIDPALKRTYSGAAFGKGAIYAWRGNQDIGQGQMEIIESQPPSKLVIKIDFIKPIEAHNTVEFVLEAHDGITTVTQTMYGPSPFISRVMKLFFDTDRMIGEKYEEGLAALKSIAESG